MKEILKAIHRMGRAQQKLTDLLSSCELLDNHSKHDPYWHSTDDEISEKLYKIRLSVNHIYDELWNIHHMLDIQQEDEDDITL